MHLAFTLIFIYTMLQHFKIVFYMNSHVDKLFEK
jgi:hypothetical protein